MVDYAKRAIRAILLLVIAVILTLFLASMALAYRDASIYPSNLSIGGVDLGGLSRNEADALLTKNLPASWGRDLLLHSPFRTISIPLDKAGISYDVPATLAKIDGFLQPEGIEEIFQHSIIRGSEANIAPQMKWNYLLLQEQLKDIKRIYDQPSVNARILYSNDYLDYISHKNGYSINAPASLDSICAALEQGSLGPVPLIVSETHPRVKLEDIKEVKDILGISTSRIDQSSANLISLTEACNGSIIMPGEGFCLTQLVREKGLHVGKASLTAVNDTIYRASVQAGLTMAESGKGLMNNLGHPVLITTIIEGNNLIVKIFGCQTEKGKEIKFITEKQELAPRVVMKVNNNLSPQQRTVVREGKSGYINRSYRVVIVNGKEISKTLLSEEFTPGQDTIIAIGPGNINK